MNTRFSTTGRVLVLMALLLALALPSSVAAANTIVTPANPDGWGPTDVRTDATVGITADNPRDGLGSLKFTTNTITAGQDKADFTKTWAVPTRTLGALTDVSFEYYRASSSTTAAHFVPVLRLLWWQDNAPAGLGAEDHTGYLIWEGIYNGINPAPTNSWEAENLTTQNFWMRLVSGPNTTGGCGKTIQNFSVTLNDWLTTNPQGQPGDCVAPDIDGSTYIYGVNTGVGSGWGATFLGYADNVVVAFGADVVSANFEPNPLCTTVCYADAVNGSDSNGGTSPADAFKTIQKAIDTVQPNGTVRVLPGSYNETATNRFVLGVNGPHQFGLFIAKNGLTIQGVTAADVAITDPNATLADITTNATNNFGFSGIFVEGDGVTIAGLEIGPNTPGENKTIEIIGDAFTLKDSLLTGDGVDGAYPYFNDWRYDTGTSTAHVKSYTVTNNVFGPGSQIAISSGAGASGPVGGRQITGNVFTMNAGQNWPSISFNGDGTTVPWFTYPVGGAVITGNSFANNAVGGMHIRTRGVADDSEFDWASYWNDNTYNKAVVAGLNPPNDVRAWSYTTSYTFNDVRVIGADIQPEIGHAQPGDTVLVKAGTYPESPTVNKSLTLLADDGRDVTFIELQTGTNYTHSLLITGAVVTVDGFTIAGIDAACPTLAATNIYLNTAPDTVVIRNNRLQVGAIDGVCSTGDDGFGLITEYSGNPDVASLTVENNIFEPLNAAGQRAFYINPSVVSFTFRGNEITGQFNGTAITQAQDSLIENNTVTGAGSSAGLGVWGDPDPTVWGHATFQGNTISGTANAISIYEAEDVTVTKNVLDANGRAVRVLAFTPLVFDKSTIHINRNALTNNTAFGIDNQLSEAGDIDGECNWWNAANGPGPVGPGGGDNVSAKVDFTPWLYTSDLDGPCFIGGTITVVKQTTPDGDPAVFEFDPSWPGPNFTLSDGQSATSPILPAGSYSVAEITLPANWTLSSASCDNTATVPVEAVSPAGITLVDGDAWTCTFNNTYTPPPPPPTVYVSAEKGGSVGAVSFGGEDILKWNGSAWSKWFDGSNAGLTASDNKDNIDAFYIPNTAGASVIFSLSGYDRKLPNIHDKLKGEDLVLWDGVKLHLYFEGDEVGLKDKSENIDALHILPGAMSPIGSGCQAYLLISTTGKGEVKDYQNKKLKFSGEDVLGFCMTDDGEDTEGKWHMVLDGSTQGMPKDSLDSLSVSADGLTYYLTTKGTFAVDAASGGHSMVYVYNVTTQTFSGPIFSAPAAGLSKKVDGLQVAP